MAHERVPGKNTKPERIARSLLHRLGYRFTVNEPNNRTLPGKPDIVFPKYKTAIFVHRCFWHRHANCKSASTPKTNTEYWQPKFERNLQRDRGNQRDLKALDWQGFVIWECELKKLDTVAARLISCLPRETSCDLPQGLDDKALAAENQARYGKGTKRR